VAGFSHFVSESEIQWAEYNTNSEECSQSDSRYRAFPLFRERRGGGRVLHLPWRRRSRRAHEGQVAGIGKAVVTYHLIDATGEEIAATEKANQETARLNALRDLNGSAIRLFQPIPASTRRRPAQASGNQTAVSVGPQIRRGHRDRPSDAGVFTYRDPVGLNRCEASRPLSDRTS
jgi:hypothetical protein